MSETRVALVTGGMGGIGTAICKALAADGFTVVANCREGKASKDEWLAARKAEGFAMHAAEADVTDYAACEAMTERIEKGIGPIAVLVNNAGIIRDRSFARMDKTQWDEVLSTNLDSLFNVTRHISPRMAERGWGRIINIASINGVKGQAGQTNYAAAKAGVLGFTRSLAQELCRRGVTVNAIAPGYIATDMVMGMREDIRDNLIATIPMQRLGRPEEIAALCTYLVSDLAAYMTGETLNINGGLFMG
ncbi:MAG TPA: acetoacetyl-CoA reductase [Rhodocyclaceae bacterium]|nr:acetoacetyl-CoA reductase [Rhodocyclaceae bacterium]